MDLFALALKITEDGASAALTKLGLIDKQGQAVEMSFGKMTGAMKGFYGALVAGAAVGALAMTVKAAAEAEETVILLQGAVENAGASFAEWSPIMEQALTHLQRFTKFGDEEGRRALAQLTTATGDAGKAYDLLGITADVAAKRHIDLASAATLVGKIANGNNAGFRQLGLTVSKNADGMAILNEKFKGFAEKQGAGVLGQLSIIKNQFGEVVEAIGRAVLGTDSLNGVFDQLVGWLQNATKWVDANADEIQNLGRVVVEVAKFVGGLFVDALDTLWSAFKGGQAVIVGVYAGITMMPDIFKRALGATIKQFGDFVGSFAILSDRLFDTSLVEKWADPLRQFGQNMETTATRSLGETQRAAQETIAEILRTADVASDTVSKVKRPSFGGIGNTAADLEAQKKAAEEAKKAHDQLIESYIILSKGAETSGEAIAFLTLFERGYTAMINAGIPDINARAEAEKKLLNVRQALKDAGVDLTSVTEQMDAAFARATAQKPVEFELPTFEFGPFVDEAVLAAEETAALALDSVDAVFDSLGGSLSQTIGDTIGGAFAGGFKGAGKMALSGLGSIFKSMGQAMLSAGLAMVKLLPAMTNPITGGPALIAAGAILLGIGAILGGIARGGGGGGVGGTYAPGYGAGINPYGPGDVTRSTMGPTSVGMGAGDLVPAPSIGPNYIIGPDDPRAQRQINELFENARRRNL